MQTHTFHLPTPLCCASPSLRCCSLVISFQQLHGLRQRPHRLFWVSRENIFLSTKNEADLPVPSSFEESSISFLLSLYVPFLVGHYLNSRYFFQWRRTYCLFQNVLSGEDPSLQKIFLTFDATRKIIYVQQNMRFSQQKQQQNVNKQIKQIPCTTGNNIADSLSTHLSACPTRHNMYLHLQQFSCLCGYELDQ